MLLLLLLVICIFVKDSNAIKSKKRKAVVERYVILDTDMGTDDGYALLMLLKAEKMFGRIQVLAITAVGGNTDVPNVLRNALKILHDMNRTDVKKR